MYSLYIRIDYNSLSYVLEGIHDVIGKPLYFSSEHLERYPLYKYNDRNC